MFAVMPTLTHHRRFTTAFAGLAFAAVVMLAAIPVDSGTVRPASVVDEATTTASTSTTYPQARPAVPVPQPTTTTTAAPTTTTTAAPTTTTTAAPTTVPAPPPDPVGPVPQLAWDHAASCDFAVSGDTPGLWPILNELTAITGIRFHSGPADPGASGIVVHNGPVPGIPSADGALTPLANGSTFTGGDLWVTARSTGDPTLLRHEMGHGFGLDHNPGTVMDARAAASRQHPNWNASETAALAAFGQRTGCR